MHRKTAHSEFTIDGYIVGLYRNYAQAQVLDLKLNNTAHNLKVVGSNPTPATNKTHHIKDFATAPFGELFAFWATVHCKLDGIGMPKSGI